MAHVLRASTARWDPPVDKRTLVAAMPAIPLRQPTSAPLVRARRLSYPRAHSRRVALTTPHTSAQACPCALQGPTAWLAWRGPARVARTVPWLLCRQPAVADPVPWALSALQAPPPPSRGPAPLGTTAQVVLDNPAPLVATAPLSAPARSTPASCAPPTPSAGLPPLTVSPRARPAQRWRAVEQVRWPAGPVWRLPPPPTRPHWCLGSVSVTR